VADYYVSPDGDDANDGTQDRPLRSLTRAVGLIAEAYVARGSIAQSEAVHLAPGLYSQASGEAFPITIPPLTTVQGSGADCVINYTPTTEGTHPCGYSERCIDLLGTLSDVSITVTWPDAWEFPVTSVCLTDQSAILERVAADLVWVDAATRVSQLPLTVIATNDGFERDGELYPLIEDCDFARAGIYGGRVERCTFSDSLWIISPGRTVIQNNQAEALRLLVVYRPVLDAPPTSDDMTPQIRNNVIQSAAALADSGFSSRIWVFGESHWEDNRIYAAAVCVGCNSTFTSNVIGAFRVDFGTVHWIHDAIGPAEEMRLNCPLFSGNTFEQIRGLWAPLDAPELESFLTVSEEACPVFEHNHFMMDDARPFTPICVRKFQLVDHHLEHLYGEWVSSGEEIEALADRIITGLPNPDFGGGAGRSPGGNTFHVSVPSVPHVKIEMGTETFQFQAQNNIWSYEPSIEIIGGSDSVSYNVDGYTLE
jgi:hypothetical protein